MTLQRFGSIGVAHLAGELLCGRGPTGHTKLVGSSSGTYVTQTVPQSGGAFAAMLNTSGLSASATPYVITYSFTGDANFNSASDSSASLTVNPAPAESPHVVSANYTNTDGNFVSGTGTLSGGHSESPAPLSIRPAAAS